jgi:hypothetical protein
MLTGDLAWRNPPETLTQSAALFVELLYVEPGREKLMMFFRQPTDHEMKIQNLIVKRTSFHRCNVPGCEALQLKVTEVKSLLFKVDPDDKNLWLGYEKEMEHHSKLMKEGRIYYEVSVINTDINDALTKNATLEIGEVTDPDSTGEALVDHDTILAMLRVTAEMVTRLDYMGMSNVGTQRRHLMEILEKQRQMAQNLGPAAKSMLPKTISQQSIQQQGSAMNSDDSNETPLPVHGLRSGIAGYVHERPDGSKYLIGMGGAEVPVLEENLLNSSNFRGSVAPDDSASQLGHPTAMPRSSGLGQTQRNKNFW